MSSRPLEHLVLLSVATTTNLDEGEEASVVLVAWRILNITKNTVQVVSEQEVYVRPREGAPSASSLPQGVSTASLQGACNLDLALKKLHEGLTKLGGSTFSIMTLGPDPMRQYLHPEAKRLSISLQKYLYHYLDLTKQTRDIFSSAPVTNDIMELTKFLGINTPSDGPVVGLVELHLYTDIVEKIMSEGHVFHNLELIKQFDSSKSTPDASLVKPDNVVIMKGLMYSAKVDDVLAFLTGLNIIPGGIVFGTNQMGRRTGMCVVVMETAEDVTLALERNRHYMGERYVEMDMSSADEFWRLADAGGPSPGGEGFYVVRLQGLPYKISEEELVEFFAPSAAVTSGVDGVLLILYPDGRASGDGYAVFSSESDYQEALSMDRQEVPQYRRYVEVYKSSVKDLKSVLSTSASRDQQARFSRLLGVTITANPEIENLRGSERKCVRLRGLPYESKPDDVLLFFGALKNDIAPKGVHMVLNVNNRPTGDCYVQMKSEDSAKRASTELNKKHMGKRYIEVFQCSGDDVAKVLIEQGIGGSSGGGYRGGSSSYRNDRGGRRGFGGGGGGGGGRRRRGSGSGNVVKARGLPYRATEDEIADFFDGFDVCAGDVELIYNRDNRPAGIALVSFRSHDLALDAIQQLDRQYLKGRYVELSFQSE